MRKTLPLFALIWLAVWSASIGPLLQGNRERVAGLAYAQSPSFYQGKTIRIVVGSDSGGLYDLWGSAIGKAYAEAHCGQSDTIL